MPTEINHQSEMDLFIHDAESLKKLILMLKESKDPLLINGLENDELDEAYLLKFIRSRGHDIHSAFNRIQRFHQVRLVQYPDVFRKLIPYKLKNVIDSNIYSVLKHLDLKGRRIIISRARNWDPSLCSGEDTLEVLFLLLWECLEDKETQQNGVIYIVDVDGWRFAHAYEFTPALVMKWSNIGLKSAPIKLKGLYFVNVHPMFTMKVFKMFLPNKMRERIHVFGKSVPGILNEFVTSSALPHRVGGDLTEEEATDGDFIRKLLSQERNSYYMQFAQPSINALSQT